MNDFYKLELKGYKGQKCDECQGLGSVNYSSGMVFSCRPCNGKRVISPVDIPFDEALEAVRKLLAKK